MQIKKTDNPLNYSLKKIGIIKIVFVFIMTGILCGIQYRIVDGFTPTYAISICHPLRCNFYSRSQQEFEDTKGVIRIRKISLI